MYFQTFRSHNICIWQHLTLLCLSLQIRDATISFQQHHFVSFLVFVSLRNNLFTPFVILYRVYSWICAQVFLLVGPRNHMGCCGSNPAQLHTSAPPPIVLFFRLKSYIILKFIKMPGDHFPLLLSIELPEFLIMFVIVLHVCQTLNTL